MKFYFAVLKMLGLEESDSNIIIILYYEKASGMEWTIYNVL